MKRILCLITDGFEEIETVTPIDILRRAGVEVTLASVGVSIHVTGRNSIVMHADTTLSQIEDPLSFDLLLLPGGPQVKRLREDGTAAVLARQYATALKPVAAICAAPLLLKDAGLLNGTRYTAHFSTRSELPDPQPEPVVTDGSLITSQGAGTSLAFALHLAETLVGPDIAREVAAAIMQNPASSPA